VCRIQGAAIIPAVVIAMFAIVHVHYFFKKCLKKIKQTGFLSMPEKGGEGY
jgi:hypothetical protein